MTRVEKLLFTFGIAAVFVAAFLLRGDLSIRREGNALDEDSRSRPQTAQGMPQPLFLTQAESRLDGATWVDTSTRYVAANGFDETAILSKDSTGNGVDAEYFRRGLQWLSAETDTQGEATGQRGKFLQDRLPEAVATRIGGNLADPAADDLWTLLSEYYPIVDMGVVSALTSTGQITVTGQAELLGYQTHVIDVPHGPIYGYSRAVLWLTDTGVKLKAVLEDLDGNDVNSWEVTEVAGGSPSLPEHQAALDLLESDIGDLLGRPVSTNYVESHVFDPDAGFPAPVPESADLLFPSYPVTSTYLLLSSSFVTDTYAADPYEVAALGAPPYGWFVTQEIEDSGASSKDLVVVESTAQTVLPRDSLTRIWPPSWSGEDPTTFESALYKNKQAGQFGDGTDYELYEASEASELAPTVVPLDFDFLIAWVESTDIQVVVLGYGLADTELLQAAEQYRLASAVQ